MLYRLIGILRCPFRNDCGPDVQEFDWEDDELNAERVCFTREHFKCPNYQKRRRQQSKPKNYLSYWPIAKLRESC